MKYLKQKNKKSKLHVIVAVLAVCLAAAAAGAWFLFGGKVPAGGAGETEPLQQPESLQLQTPYGSLFFEGAWVSCLRYEAVEEDMTQLHFAAEIGGTTAKLFSLYFGSEENLAGFLSDGAGERIPVSVAVWEILPPESWSAEDQELAFAMQDRINDVLSQLGIDTALPEVPEETLEAPPTVTLETAFGSVSYQDVWNGGLRIQEAERRILGFGTVPGKPEQKLFEISVGGDGEIPAGTYTDQNGQKISVFLIVPELTMDADWTEEEQHAIYAMQNVLNELMDQLELVAIEQPQEMEAPLADVVVTTSYGTVSYAGSYKGQLRVVQDYSNGFRLKAYATMQGKAEVHLFDIVIGSTGDVYAGVMTDTYGNRKEVYLNVPDLNLDDSWSEEERSEVLLMQNLLNDFCEQLAVSKEEEKLEGNPTGVAAGDVMVWTAYGTLQYPGEYRQKLVTEITGANGNTVCFFAMRSTGERIGLFEVIFGGTGDAYVGQHTAKDGTVCEVYITSNEITPDDSWTDEELETIFGMHEAANYVLDKMVESGILRY